MCFFVGRAGRGERKKGGGEGVGEGEGDEGQGLGFLKEVLLYVSVVYQDALCGQDIFLEKKK